MKKPPVRLVIQARARRGRWLDLFDVDTSHLPHLARAAAGGGAGPDALLVVSPGMQLRVVVTTKLEGQTCCLLSAEGRAT